MATTQTDPADDVRVSTPEESGVVRTLEVEVDARRVRKAFDKAYKSLARQARVRGFRPGKAPQSVLEKLYGAQVLEEIERTLVSETLPQAVAQSGLRPVTEPTVDAQPPARDASFRYRAQIEVKPSVELPELAGLPGRRTPVSVGEVEVDGELERLRTAQAPLVEEAEGTAAQRGHVLRIDFVGRVDGEAFEGGTGSDVEVELGSDRFVPGFAEQLEGARAGEDCTVTVTFPEDYGDAGVAGREAEFAVHVHAVLRRDLPALDDEFAKDVGDFDTLAALRAHLEAQLRGQREQRARQVLQRSVLDALVDRTPFDVPPGLVERRLQSQLARAHRELEGQVPEEALQRQLQSWQEAWRPRAERDVREALLLEAVAEAESLEVADEEIEERVRAMAVEQGVDAARLLKAYREGDMLPAVRASLLDDKALDFLCAQAKVEEVSNS